MEKTQNILCFICRNYFPGNELQNHVYKCKLTYETKTMQRINLPEEYQLLFKTYKGGLSLSDEDVENFNNLFASKSVKKASAAAKPASNFSNTTSVSSSGAGFSNSGFSNSPSKFGSTSSKPPARQPGQRPRMLICPLCGREFGTASLNFHLKSCRQKFENEQQNLPKNMRRSADKIIESYNQNNAIMQASGNYNLDAMNDQAFETYNKEALVPCENCGRTFLPDRLIVHLRSCKKKIK